MKDGTTAGIKVLDKAIRGVVKSADEGGLSSV